MANHLPRQRSRRRLAALTFLSNISLDGTHRDTNLYGVLHKDMSKIYARIEQSSDGKENITQEENVDCCKDQTDIDISKKTESEMKTTAQCSLPNQKSVTADIIKKPIKKLSTNTITGIEKVPCFSTSSSESLVPSVGGSRTRKVSSSWSEASAPAAKEVKSIKFSSSVQVKEERIVILSSEKFPFHITSFIPYYRNRSETYSKEGRKRHTSATRPLSTISDSVDPPQLLGIVGYEDAVISYSDFLVPSNYFSSNAKHSHVEVSDHNEICSHPGLARCFSYEPATHRATAHYIPNTAHGTRSSSFSVSGSRVLLKLMETGSSNWHKICTGITDKADMQLPMCQKNDAYEPNVIDDPELQAGKHRKLLRFPSYMTSVLDYTKRCELKKELNDKFKCKFPHIQLTISKLRSLKREMLKIAKMECGIDLLTVAHAYVYFEQLIMKSIVNKQTRKLVAGACLILAAKMNDVKGDTLTTLIEKTESIFRLNRRELMQWEVASLVTLEFALHVPVWHVKPHYQRLVFES